VGEGQKPISLNSNIVTITIFLVFVALCLILGLIFLIEIAEMVGIKTKELKNTVVLVGKCMLGQVHKRSFWLHKYYKSKLLK
jgi:hypothetical protein